MIKHFLATLTIWLFLVLPLQIIGYPLVALLMLTKWDGRTTWWGNAKHGKGEDRSCDTPWKQYLWLVWRNPVNNFLSFPLAIICHEYSVQGDPTIWEKSHGGFYAVRMGKFWEYYWIKPYGKRCIRLRYGWKIVDEKPGELCEFVLTFNPVKAFGQGDRI